MILLDTHAWIWWCTEDKRLSAKARNAIERADSLGVSVISCWEVAMLVAKGRIGFKMDVGDWIKHALNRPKVSLIQADPKALILATRLPGNFTGDPADCIILATSLCYGLEVVSKDRRMHAYRQVTTVW